MKEALSISGPAGRIEVLLEQPRETSPSTVAVLCHPHPQFQGTMLNKVVHTLSRSMNDLGIPAVRFNFRGIGASEGEYADGFGEATDTLTVADWACQRFPGAKLWLGGFSFGAMVAGRAALAALPGRLIMIAPAVDRMKKLMDDAQPDCPWLIIQGDEDEVVSCDAVVDWVNWLNPGPELVLLSGVDHFFHGRLTLLRETLVSHLK